MSKTDAWTRRLELLHILMARGKMQTHQAARALGVERRTVLEDLKALSEHGVPIAPDSEDARNPERAWVLEDAWRRVGMTFGLADRLSVRFGREMLEGFLHETDLGRAFSKLDDVVASHTEGRSSPAHDELARRFIYVQEPAKQYGAHSHTMAELVEAIVRAQPVSFTYTRATFPRTEKRHKNVSPYTLAVYRRGLYAIVQLHKGTPVTFAIERMSDFERNEKLVFEYPRKSEYDPKKLLLTRFGLSDDGKAPEVVRLRFAPEARVFAEERMWMANQKVTPLEDGGCDIEFKASGLEIINRIMEYGHFVEVLAPARLRNEVGDRLAKALAHYRG